MKKYFLLNFLILIIAQISFAQKSMKDSVFATSLISFNYAFQVPSGDLQYRFGNNSNIGISFTYKTKHNITFSTQNSLIFGNSIREKFPLESISEAGGLPIASNGQEALVRAWQRGFLNHILIGKIIPISSKNKNSGIWIQIGGGFMQHKIRIENIGKTAPQLSAEYLKGYDRLTNGFSTQQFIGYFYLSNLRLINFYAGLELNQAWTQSRRDWDFDLMKKDTQKRFDVLNGFRIGWIIPLYGQSTNKYYSF